jgi:hypothetical protein
MTDPRALFEASVVRGWRLFLLAGGDRVHLWSPSDSYMIALPLEVARALLVTHVGACGSLREAVQQVTAR